LHNRCMLAVNVYKRCSFIIQTKDRYSQRILHAKIITCINVCKKVKSSRYRPTGAKRVSRGIALLFLDLSARRGWVVSTTPRPLYPRERPGTHCTGGWVDLRAGLDVCEKSRPHRDFFFNESLFVSKYRRAGSSSFT
jgi:hypothetical protein